MQPYFIPPADKPIYQHISDSAVIFFDMADFIETTHSFRDKDVVYAMHFCFSAFEQILSLHAGKLIKTNADQCLILIDHDEGQHVWHCVTEIFSAFYRICAYYNIQGQLRCGAHRGEIIAGYIGVQKRYFDIWGKTVNIASRLETNAAQNTICMSKSFYDIHCPYKKISIESKHLKGYGPWNTLNYDLSYLRHH